MPIFKEIPDLSAANECNGNVSMCVGKGYGFNEGR